MLAQALPSRRWRTLEAVPFVGSVIGIALAIATFGVLGYQLYAATTPSPLGQALWYLLFLNAVLLATLCLLAFDLHRRDVMLHDKQNDVARLESEVLAAADRCDKLNARILLAAEKLYSLSIVYIELLTYLKNVPSHTNLDDVRDRTNAYLVSILNCFTAACDIYTGIKCSSCIKN